MKSFTALLVTAIALAGLPIMGHAQAMFFQAAKLRIDDCSRLPAESRANCEARNKVIQDCKAKHPTNLSMAGNCVDGYYEEVRKREVSIPRQSRGL
jgi:hypothetical protein